uniref:MADS-box domain-containing protein n=1 Tax=Kalanchoe fedtschenkoi TaxID=63787 RepID=A0A7N0UDR5_KALFE
MDQVEKKNKGRRKIRMAKMEKESNLLVTFSKRRSGLFKKASELCTLCGVQIAIIVFSPGKKVFSFGHPNVETIVDRYLTRTTSPNFSSPTPNNNTNIAMMEAHRSSKIRELNAEVTEATNQLEGEKKRGEAMDKMRKMNQNKCWWENNVCELNLSQLHQLRIALEGLKIDVGKEAGKRVMGPSTSNQIIPYMGIDYNGNYSNSNGFNHF